VGSATLHNHDLSAAVTYRRVAESIDTDRVVSRATLLLQSMGRMITIIPMTLPLEHLTQHLARLATHYDIGSEWPIKSLDHLTEAGAWTWIIPEQYGGRQLDPESQILAYEAVAAGCMASLLILTQRDGACELISSSPNEHLKQDLLPRLAAHELMTSVGISQLTTSHQAGKPALIATPDGPNYRLRGFMPWVTSAEKCDFIVTGVALPESAEQILAVVPTDRPGIQIDPPMNLMALGGTLTSEVHCRDVVITPDDILQGPAVRALERRSAVKALVVAAAGVGLAGTMARSIAKQAVKTSGPLRESAEEILGRYEAVRDRLRKNAGRLNQPEAEVPAAELRIAVNDLLMRLAIATLTYAKGSGFIRQRDAQRLVREAMFFLVWSTPEDIRAQTLAGFLDTPEPKSKSMKP